MSETADTRRVSGQVTYEGSGEPAVGVRVRVLDRDMLFDDALEEATTDDEGHYEVTYDLGEYRDRFERMPDVYLEVCDDDGTVLTDTRDATVRNAGPSREIHVELPRGCREPDRERPTVEVAGYPVDEELFAQLDPDTVVLLADPEARDDEEHAELLAGLNPAFAPERLAETFCEDPLVRFLEATVERKDWDREVRLELESALMGYDPDASYDSYSCGNFSITYPTTGSSAPDSDDSGGDIVEPGTGDVVGSTTGGNGVPDYVEKVCFWLENALSTYTNPPFDLTDPSASGTIPVELTDATQSGRVRSRTVQLNPSLNDDLVAAVPTHELMHLIQDQYQGSGTSGGWNPGVREGGATLGEDVVFDSHNRYVVEVSESGGTLEAPNRSLKSSGQRYELSLFLKYISEQQSHRVEGSHEPAIGVDTYRELLETFDANGYDDDAFRDAVIDLPWYQRFTDFAYLDPGRNDRTSAETLVGNFWLACYLKDFGVEVPDRRFDFMEDDEDATWDSIFRGSDTVSTLEELDLARTVSLSSGGSVTLSSGGSSVPAFAARVYKVDVDSAVDTLEVDFDAGSGFDSPIVQVALVEPESAVASPEDQVRDIIRSDRTDFERTIANDRDGTDLDHVAIVVAGTENGGSYSLSVSEVSPAPDVTISRWHTAKGDHYEIDPFKWAWTWVSPDVWVDNDGDGTADDEVYFGRNNDLFVRLRNQGHERATNVSVDLYYQDAAGGLSPGAWQPVEDASGTVQTLTGLSLAAETTDEWSVDWAPSRSGSSNHFCIRAVISAPGDPNTDNKRALSNFDNVVTASPYVDLPLLRRLPQDAETSRIDVVPRAGGRWRISESDLAAAAQREPVGGNPVHDEFRIRKFADMERRSGHVEPTSEFADRQQCGFGTLDMDQRIPDPTGDYATDPEALPPGVDGSDLITITHVADGAPVGGYTWAIREED